jgi:hypothetical protein
VIGKDNTTPAEAEGSAGGSSTSENPSQISTPRILDRTPSSELENAVTDFDADPKSSSGSEGLSSDPEISWISKRGLGKALKEKGFRDFEWFFLYKYNHSMGLKIFPGNLLKVRFRLTCTMHKKF